MGSEDQTQVPVFALQALDVWAISQPHLTNIFLVDNEDLNIAVNQVDWTQDLESRVSCFWNWKVEKTPQPN